MAVRKIAMVVNLRQAASVQAAMDKGLDSLIEGAHFCYCFVFLVMMFSVVVSHRNTEFRPCCSCAGSPQ